MRNELALALVAEDAVADRGRFTKNDQGQRPTSSDRNPESYSGFGRLYERRSRGTWTRQSFFVPRCFPNKSHV
jgi:hypothetical protein